MPIEPQKKNCPFCDKDGLFILPLRYAAVVGDKAKAWITELPPGLGKNVSDIDLSKAAYAPRFARQGFIYVLINRTGQDKVNSVYWEAYQTTSDGFLAKFIPGKPPSIAAEFTCSGNFCKINASLISISKVTEVNKIYLFFSPTAISVKKMNEFQADPEQCVKNGQLQGFDPKGWADGTYEQEHSLMAKQLKAHVPELLLHDQGDDAPASNRGHMLINQMYPAMRDSFVGRKASSPGAAPSSRLGALVHAMEKDKSATVVLYDHIGITQELNNFRNAALQPLRDYMAKVESHGATNQRKFSVLHAIEETKAGYLNRSISKKGRYLSFINKKSNADDLIIERAALLEKGKLIEAARLDEAISRGLEEDEEHEEWIKNDNAESDWNKSYGCLLDEPGMTRLKKQVEDLSKVANANVTLRYSDHVKWLTSSRLVTAFDMYDNTNLGSGFCFHFEYGMCIDGMFGVAENLPLLKEWMSSAEVSRNNLFMRSNLYNYKDLEIEAEKAFRKAKDLVAAEDDISGVQSTPWLKAAKGFIDLTKKIDSAWDEWLRDGNINEIHKPTGKNLDHVPQNIKNLSTYHLTAEGRMFRNIASWTQAISSKPSRMDKVIGAIVTMLVFSKMAELSEVVGIETYMLSMSKAKKDEIEKANKKGKNLREIQKANHDKFLKSKAKIYRKAAAKAAKEAAHFEGMAAKLLRDEQEKIKMEMSTKIKEAEALARLRKINPDATIHDIVESRLSDGDRPGTNNFRQARMACLLLSIEAIALTLKLKDYHDSPRMKAEITASLLSVTSISIDIVYSVTKSAREIAPFKTALGVSGALDIARGGLKLYSGIASCVSGMIVGALDVDSMIDEFGKKRTDWVLATVYGARGTVGIISAGVGMFAAYSYAGAYLTSISTALGHRLGTNTIVVILRAAAVANGIVVSRTLWLLRLARLNMVGLALTGVEIGYRCFIKDDEMENWVQASCLRKFRPLAIQEKPFATEEKELLALSGAIEAILA